MLLAGATRIEVISSPELQPRSEKVIFPVAGSVHFCTCAEAVNGQARSASRTPESTCDFRNWFWVAIAHVPVFIHW